MVEENLAKYIITEVKKGTLKVHWKKGARISHKKAIHITIPISEIDGVSLGGSGSIISKITVKSNELKINLAGSGNMNLDIETANLETNISGSGNFNSFELTVGDSNTKISGSGNIKITVNGKFIAKISGPGNIKYKGNPTTESVKVSGSGNVTKK